MVNLDLVRLDVEPLIVKPPTHRWAVARYRSSVLPDSALDLIVPRQRSADMPQTAALMPVVPM
ncbi:hypothetical protein GCM10022243_64980 [Saccharothrix violaceirubra]